MESRPLKSSHRLDYHRFTEALVEQGLVSEEAIVHITQQCAATGTLLPEVLVSEELISDWELTRLACEVFGLPFVDVASYPPNEEALGTFDPEYLRLYGLVPLDRFGSVITVAMPGLVPTEVLDALASEGERVMPVVSAVTSNRRWLDEHLPRAPMPSLEEIKGMASNLESEELEGWSGIFDAGDEAVRLDLSGNEETNDTDADAA